MRRRYLASVLLLTSLLVVAQNGGEVEITAEPHHQLALMNQYVRVFKVDVPPHQATLMHCHRHDYVYVTLGATELENDVEGKPPARLKLQDGETRFSPGPFAHVVKVLADTPFRNVTIELLQDRNPDMAKWDEERGLDILQGGTEDVLFVKDGARVSDIQLQPGAMIPQHRHPGPHLLVAVTDLELRTSPSGKTSKPVELKVGDVRWIPAGPAHTLMNLGNRPARFITVEFK
jgi:quercetin dioxygenase-like cupin family protein